MSKTPMCTNCKDNPVAMGVLHSRGHPSSRPLVWIPCKIMSLLGCILLMRNNTHNKRLNPYIWIYLVSISKKIYPISLLGCTFWVVSSQYLGEQTSSYFAVHQGARNPTAIFARNLSPCGFCLIPHLQWFISLLFIV